MIQSNIVLTQTFIDQDKLKKQLAYSFFEIHKETRFNINDVNLYNIEDNILGNIFEKGLSESRILDIYFDDKKDFREKLIQLYQQRNKPALVFLGDLDKYSIPLQEGMLRLLEEPPQNTFIVLFAKTKTNLLPTITSRSQLHLLNTQNTFSILDSSLLEKTKKKLPDIKSTFKSLLSPTSNILFKDIPKLEREEIDFWIWQIQSYLESYFQKSPNKKTARLIENCLRSKQLNTQNCQKKFVLNSINLDNYS